MACSRASASLHPGETKKNHHLVSPFFSRNIGLRGRLLRCLGGLAILLAAYLLRQEWVSGALAGAGVFLLFEAVLGWCLLRACNIRTPL